MAARADEEPSVTGQPTRVSAPWPGRTMATGRTHPAHAKGRGHGMP